MENYMLNKTQLTTFVPRLVAYSLLRLAAWRPRTNKLYCVSSTCGEWMQYVELGTHSFSCTDCQTDDGADSVATKHGKPSCVVVDARHIRNSYYSKFIYINCCSRRQFNCENFLFTCSSNFLCGNDSLRQSCRLRLRVPTNNRSGIWKHCAPSHPKTLS